jgi:RNA polymerase sigma-54 factor
MSLTLDIGLVQQVKLSPEMRQSLDLLQLSTVDLDKHIYEMLVTNPMLEQDISGAHENNIHEPQEEEIRSEEFEDGALSNDDEIFGGGEDTSEQWSSNSVNDRATFDSYQGNSETSPAYDNVAEPVGLHGLLRQELALLKLSQRDRGIAEAIIVNVDGYGRLDCCLEDIQKALQEEFTVEIDNVEMVLKLLQSLDPAGICARDLLECYLLQLERYDDASDTVQMAKLVVTNHYDLFEKLKFDQIIELTGMSESNLREVTSLISSLDPNPGQQISSATIRYITPDVRVKKVDQKWVAQINPENEHRLCISKDRAYYKDHMKKYGKKEDAQFLESCHEKADWLLRSLSQRSATILKVANAIVEHQNEFFSSGFEKLKPLNMSEIAEQVGIHESTVSRAVRGKYIETPYGNLALRSFFPSHLNTDAGEEAAALVVRVWIRRLIDSEPKHKPFSDNVLMTKLNEKGYQISRRTVTKYRKQMNIPATPERREQG